MARPQVFSSPTTLYHPIEGPRVFPAGETDPGAAWSDNPGGDRSETSMPSVMKDLIDANDRADALGVKLDKQAYDMAQTAADATAAKEALADAEQRAVAAEAAQKVAEDGATTYMAERDAARAELATAQQALADNDESTKARIAELAAQLETANQTIADLSGQVATLQAAADKAAKPAKAAEGADTTTAPDAAAKPAGDGADTVSGA